MEDLKLKKTIVISIILIITLTGCSSTKNNIDITAKTPISDTTIKSTSPNTNQQSKDITPDTEDTNNLKPSPQDGLNTNKEDTSQSSNSTYSITTATSPKDNIKIQYPQIKGMTDNSKENTINDLIKNDILKSQVEDRINAYQDATEPNVKLTLDLNYQVTMNTTTLLSFVYTGYSNIEGTAHPTSIIYGVTFDLENATKLELSDFTTLDTNFAKKIKQSTAVTNDTVKNGMDKDVLITAIKSIDDQTLIQGLKTKWAYNTFYVTPNSLVVSVEVIHAIGDYALVELPGEYTKK
jgi:hypothetical protein